MHPTRAAILQKLTARRDARYSEIKPKGVDGNLFVYHLGALRREGLVAKRGTRYALTAAGRHLSSRLSFDTFRERIQPKIVTTVILERRGEHLLYRQRRAPFIDYVSFPYGKIHLEERVAEAAARELHEKSGLTASLTYRGDVYVTVHDDAELVTHTLHHVFTGEKVSGDLRTDYPGGKCFWGRLADEPKGRVLPGVKQMLRLASGKKKGLFFAEYFLGIGDGAES